MRVWLVVAARRWHGAFASSAATSPTGSRTCATPCPTSSGPEPRVRRSPEMAASLPLPSAAEALDAYSEVVTGVAERLLPSVASLRVDRRLSGERRAGGAGSAGVISADGYLTTSAHDGGRAWGGVAAFLGAPGLPF